jgi:hypothetical protein
MKTQLLLVGIIVILSIASSPSFAEEQASQDNLTTAQKICGFSRF